MDERDVVEEATRLAERVAAASTRLVARYWYAEAQRIAEHVEDPGARWDILVTALRRVGWRRTSRQ